MEKTLSGEQDDEQVEGDGAGKAAPAEVIVEDVGLEPPPPEFVLDMPHISNIDL